MTRVNNVASSDVTAVLVTAFKQLDAPKGYIISGFPRNMADLHLYLEHIGRVDGVILLNWHEAALSSQIEYGAKRGQVELSVAKAELKHFKKHVIPVAEFFDYKQLLYVVRVIICVLFQGPSTVAARA
jgi:adenylate kinase